MVETLKGAFSKSWKPGKCKLCFEHSDHLERHHVSYRPEITIDICHQCHFTAHFCPNRFTRSQKLKLLDLVMQRWQSMQILSEYEFDPIMLAKLFAPSRREAIHQFQREERERVRTAQAS